MKTKHLTLRMALLGCLSLLMLAAPINSTAVVIVNADAASGKIETGITKEERAQLVQYLQDVKKQLMAELSGLSDAQWKFKADDKSWSAANIVEHLVAVEEFVYGSLTEKILKAPARPELKGDNGPRMKDNVVRLALTNRVASRFQSPERFTPKNLFAAKADAVAAFDKATARTLAFAESCNDDLRSHFAEHPVLGTIDAYQWVLAIAAHVERHMLQFQELKADPKYPKR